MEGDQKENGKFEGVYCTQDKKGENGSKKAGEVDKWKIDGKWLMNHS